MARRRVAPGSAGLAVLASLSVLTGCALEPAVRNSLGGVGLITAGVTPSANLEQVYYLGVFDPQEQLPPTLYRLRVRGQGSALNFTRYASGWVRAELIDSLSSVATFKDKTLESGVQVSVADQETAALTTGRRLVMFGPEGFREAPKGHRLVVVMGSSPEKFFQAVDQALGIVASVTQGQSGPVLEQALFRDLLRLRSERERLEDLRANVKQATGSAQ